MGEAEKESGLDLGEFAGIFRQMAEGMGRKYLLARAALDGFDRAMAEFVAASLAQGGPAPGGPPAGSREELELTRRNALAECAEHMAGVLHAAMPRDGQGQALSVATYRDGLGWPAVGHPAMLTRSGPVLISRGEVTLDDRGEDRDACELIAAAWGELFGFPAAAPREV